MSLKSHQVTLFLTYLLFIRIEYLKILSGQEKPQNPYLPCMIITDFLISTCPAFKTTCHGQQVQLNSHALTGPVQKPLIRTTRLLECEEFPCSVYLDIVMRQLGNSICVFRSDLDRTALGSRHPVQPLIASLQGSSTLKYVNANPDLPTLFQGRV